MSSPFTYEDPVATRDLVARGPELALLGERLADLRNSRVEGPRRFGKTSLVQAALRTAADDGLVPVYVNFLGVLTVEDVAERIDLAYRTQLVGPLQRWFEGVARTWRPQASANVAGVGVAVTPTAGGPLLERLALPRRLAERKGKRCAIAFDEFQELVRIGEHVPGIFRSELETHRDVAGYVFSGSHPGLMRSLFSDRRHAFFAQASAVSLGPLPADELGEFITTRFAAHGDRDPGEALGPLLDLVRGHPQRAMLVAHHLFRATPPGATSTTDTWAEVTRAVFQEVGGEVIVAWGGFSDLERRVLSVVADETIPLSGAAAHERYGLAKSPSNRRAAERLWAAGHLVESPTPTGWQVTDPLLRLWVASGRRWPT